jgi:exo-1,4-beta-D-glucosaminidase
VSPSPPPSHRWLPWRSLAWLLACASSPATAPRAAATMAFAAVRLLRLILQLAVPTQLLPAAAASAAPVVRTQPIRDGWSLASSAALAPAAAAGGAQISTPGYATPAPAWARLKTFPATVLSALDEIGDAAPGVAPGKIFFSQNFKAVQTSRFDVPWWYRVDLPPTAAAAATAGGRALLTFTGLNYRANIWVNGKLLATNSTVAGAYIYTDIDITSALVKATPSPPQQQGGGGVDGRGAAAAVAIEVTRSYDWGLDCRHPELPPNEQASCRGRNKSAAQDLGITWVDWAPAPHDGNMGLWRDVILTTISPATPAVTCRYPGVHTRLSTDHTSAQVEVSAELRNWGPTPQSGHFQVQLGTLGTASVAVHLPAAAQLTKSPHPTDKNAASAAPPSATRLVSLNISLSGLTDAELWWPWQMGRPTLHNLTMGFAAAPTSSRRGGGGGGGVEWLGTTGVH